MESNQTRIAIAGIGGIGGYIGGKLAHYYAGNPTVEIIFIARGEIARAIESNGLNLRSKEVLYLCRPSLTTDDPTEIGSIDVLIICTKTFAVTDVLKKYAGNLVSNAVVITTQNTVSGRVAISPYLPAGIKLMEGCIYIASNITGPGLVEHIGGPAKLIFGNDGGFDDNGAAIEKILTDADIDAAYITEIGIALWRKFLFVSPVAIVTALFDITFAQVLENAETAMLFRQLTQELMALATAKNIPVDEQTVAKNTTLLASFKGAVQSSFQLDLKQGKQSEVASLVAYVTSEATRLNIAVPCYEYCMARLHKRYQI